MATASAEVGEKSVRYDGRDYATLDFTAPRTNTYGKQQNTFLELPEGWVLAEKSEGVLKEVVAKFPWGAKALVLDNGESYWTSIMCGVFGANPGVLGPVYALEKSGRGFKPTFEFSRVLICTEVEVSAEQAADGDHCARAMARLWETGEFADCEVACNGHVFQCHRSVLAQASPVFKQMLSGGMMEAKTQRIQLEALETEMEAVSAFLKFVYTGALDCKSEHFPTVVKLADFYQLDCVTEKTCNRMLKAVDKGNVVPIARLFRSVRKKPRVGPYWTKLADKVVQSKELAIALMSEV